mmetsp:Transcript_46643/g.122485  ORF Transcript_46643/g.122485 Transcript_46643/m.122485 type:complete len:261 (-) Transcript_46643:640-1422(-)
MLALVVGIAALNLTPRAPTLRYARMSTREAVCCSITSDAMSVDETIANEPCVMFSRESCPFCLQTRECLDELGAEYRVVDLESQPSLCSNLAQITGRTSVPAVFVGGAFVGGANDGGMGGALTLQREGKLAPLLTEAGALDPNRKSIMADPIAQLFSKVLFKGNSGKRIFFGVLQQDVVAETVPDAEERAVRRAVAARELTNIDAEERARRRLAGTAFSGITVLLAFGLLATQAAPLSRVAIAPPLFLSYGFLASAREGL